MALSEFYESTILKVSATFGFSGFNCDPSEITEALAVEPVETLRKGEPRHTKWGKTVVIQENSWVIESSSKSKDVNEHLRELLGRLAGRESIVRPEWNPAFSVLWKNSYLYAGSGPFYESDVVKGIASLNASLWQDIYQIDAEE